MFSFLDDLQGEFEYQREIVEVIVEEKPKKRRYFDFDRNYEECA